MDQQPSTPNPNPPAASKKIGRIIVDRELCIGAATCLAFAAKTFRLDAENKAIVIDPPGDDEAAILEAARSCPTNAIILKDQAGNQIHPPKN